MNYFHLKWPSRTIVIAFFLSAVIVSGLVFFGDRIEVDLSESEAAVSYGEQKDQGGRGNQGEARSTSSPGSAASGATRSCSAAQVAGVCAERQKARQAGCSSREITSKRDCNRVSDLGKASKCATCQQFYANIQKIRGTKCRTTEIKCTVR